MHNGRARVTAADGVYEPGEAREEAPRAALRLLAGGDRPESADEREERLARTERLQARRWRGLTDGAMDLGRRERQAAEARRQRGAGASR